MHFLVIGVGSIGERHLRNFLRVPDVRCSIAEVDTATRERVAGDHAVEAAYPDYRAADLARFDGVVICVPANLHVPMALDVVSAGTHVLTEKPLAMSLEGVDLLKQRRDERGVVVSVAFPLRSSPVYRELRDRVAAGDLGAVRLVHYYTGQYWPDMRQAYPPAYAQSRDTGGGAIPDHLVHLINHFEWMLGPVEAVSAHHWRLGLHDIATEDSAQVTLRFAGGAVAVLGTCLCQRDTITQLQVVAERGTMRIRDGADAVEIFQDDADRWRPGSTAALERDGIFLEQARHFIDCIAGRATPRCTVEEAEQTLRTVLAALASADGDGRLVAVAHA